MKFICRMNGMACPVDMTYKTEVLREINGVMIKTPREVIKFDDGAYETNDTEKIAFIKRHKMYDVNIFEVEEEKYQSSQKASPEEMKIIEEHKKKGRPKKVS